MTIFRMRYLKSGNWKPGRFNSQSDSQAVKEAAARNKNVIKSMCLHMAHDCNLRCQYCFASTGDFHGERALMPLDVAKAAMDFFNCQQRLAQKS